MKGRKQIRKWKRKARDAGWRFKRRGGNHEKWYAPNGEDIVIVAISPSDHRALKNARSHLRRAGLNI